MSSSFIKVGPAGSATGVGWDEKGHGQIVQMFISHEYGYIKSIQFQYVENENVTSEKHGKHDGSKFDVVQLNYPVEYITWVIAHVDTFNYTIRSITFGTNRGTYGPFGDSSSDYVKKYKFEVGEGRQFGGFYGTFDGMRINSI